MPNDMPFPELTLATIAGGGLEEIFQHEFNQVLENVLDVNTDPKKKRTVTLQIVIEPSADRETVSVTVKSKSALAAFESQVSNVYVGKRYGRAYAVINDPKQMQIKWDEESKLRNVATKDDAEKTG